MEYRGVFWAGAVGHPVRNHFTLEREMVSQLV